MCVLVCVCVHVNVALRNRIVESHWVRTRPFKSTFVLHSCIYLCVSACVCLWVWLYVACCCCCCCDCNCNWQCKSPRAGRGGLRPYKYNIIQSDRMKSSRVWARVRPKDDRVVARTMFDLGHLIHWNWIATLSQALPVHEVTIQTANLFSEHNWGGACRQWIPFRLIEQPESSTSTNKRLNGVSSSLFVCSFARLLVYSFAGKLKWWYDFMASHAR